MNNIQKEVSLARAEKQLCINSRYSVFFWLKKYKFLYLMLIPGIIYFIIFRYLPIFGLVIAFKNFNFTKGIFGSEWVGLKHFISFFNYPESWRLIRNTFLLNLYNIIFAFPIAIIFAVLLNEVRESAYKKLVQTVSYLPHFISTVVVVGIFYNFLSPSTGLINIILKDVFGVEPIAFLLQTRWFRTIYNTINIWQETGWNAIIYLAALIGIDPALYESAYMDGAGRFKQFLYISLPCITSTIVIMLVLRIGIIMEVGFESVMLLHSPATYEVSDIIPTYVYRRGIIDSDYSFTTAIGMFQSIIGLVLMLLSNKLAKKLTNSGLW